MSSTPNENKIRSIIDLMDDQDEQTYRLLEDEILRMGADVIPFLKDALDETTDELKTNRLNYLSHQLNLNHASEELISWKNNSHSNLFEGLMIVAKLRYPNLDVQKIYKYISKLRQDLWLEINDNLTALEKIRVLNHIFFVQHGYKGNTKDYYAPENSFINDVLINKKGNPLLLSAIYSILAQSVNIPVYGVNLPRHFLLAYTDKLYQQPFDQLDTHNVLFYINPFGKGEIHNLRDIRKFLNNLNIKPNNEYLLPCPNSKIIKRCLANLVSAYQNKAENQYAEDFGKLLKIMDDGSETEQDLGGF
jgi:regulator of sirC expression with transglutaminase-like and TPR domain